jgi:hypothetical protein
MEAVCTILGKEQTWSGAQLLLTEPTILSKVRVCACGCLFPLLMCPSCALARAQLGQFQVHDFVVRTPSRLRLARIVTVARYSLEVANTVSPVSCRLVVVIAIAHMLVPCQILAAFCEWTLAVHDYGKLYEEKPKEAEAEFKRVKEIAEHKAAVRRAAKADAAAAGAGAGAGAAGAAKPHAAATNGKPAAKPAAGSRPASARPATSAGAGSAGAGAAGGASLSKTVTSARPKSAKPASVGMGGASPRAAGARSAAISSSNSFWRITEQDRAKPGFVDVYH